MNCTRAAVLIQRTFRGFHARELLLASLLRQESARRASDVRLHSPPQASPVFLRGFDRSAYRADEFVSIHVRHAGEAVEAVREKPRPRKNSGSSWEFSDSDSSDSSEITPPIRKRVIPAIERLQKKTTSVDAHEAICRAASHEPVRPLKWREWAERWQRAEEDPSEWRVGVRFAK